MTSVRPDVHTSIADLQLPWPVSVPRTATVRDAAAAMQDAGVSCVLVGEEPWWVVTERDLVGALAAGLGPATPVAEVSSTAPVWVTPGTHLPDGFRMMARHHVRHLVVVGEDGRPRAVVALEDLLPAFEDWRQPD